jgi:hypothetical protein
MFVNCLHEIKASGAFSSAWITGGTKERDHLELVGVKNVTAQSAPLHSKKKKL